VAAATWSAAGRRTRCVAGKSAPCFAIASHVTGVSPMSSVLAPGDQNLAG
jgi:hypothetical protein